MPAYQLEKLIDANAFADTRSAEELVRIEPSHELAHQFIMRFHALRGDQSAALRQFGLLEQALAEELDSEPSEASNGFWSQSRVARCPCNARSPHPYQTGPR